MMHSHTRSIFTVYVFEFVVRSRCRQSTSSYVGGQCATGVGGSATTGAKSQRNAKATCDCVRPWSDEVTRKSTQIYIKIKPI